MSWPIGEDQSTVNAVNHSMQSYHSDWRVQRRRHRRDLTSETSSARLSAASLQFVCDGSRFTPCAPRRSDVENMQQTAVRQRAGPGCLTALKTHLKRTRHLSSMPEYIYGRGLGFRWWTKKGNSTLGLLKNPITIWNPESDSHHKWRNSLWFVQL